MNTRIENFVIESDIVYPDLNSSKREFERVRRLSDDELRTLIGSLVIGNKYLVLVANTYIYRHDDIHYVCKSV
jgi:hypothetical protein